MDQIITSLKSYKLKIVSTIIALTAVYLFTSNYMSTCTTKPFAQEYILFFLILTGAINAYFVWSV
uniref:Uncharacterized protein n=1 Tax=viral metagenome TaxID=1070528 RepID=A0A6C0JAV6_9ZZZZ